MFIAHLLNPDPPTGCGQDGGRAASFAEIAIAADYLRQAAHQQWAAEYTPTELARHTENTAITLSEIRTALTTGTTTVTMSLPDGMTPVAVRLATVAGTKDADLDGWTTGPSDAPLPLSPVTATTHLEIQSPAHQPQHGDHSALHPDLLDLDEP